jgi:hypothetical protein
MPISYLRRIEVLEGNTVVTGCAVECEKCRMERVLAHFGDWQADGCDRCPMTRENWRQSLSEGKLLQAIAILRKVCSSEDIHLAVNEPRR